MGSPHFDEFDLVILDGIEKGYFDDAKLASEADKMVARLLEGDGSNSFSAAWALYHDSFDDNQEVVLDSLYKSFTENVKIISPMDLDSTVRLFKEFHREDQAKEMLKLYVTEHPGDKAFYNLSEYAFREDIKDPDVISTFNEKKDSFIDRRDRMEVLRQIVIQRGWNPEDIDLLKKITADEFYTMFKSASGPDLKIAVRGAVGFVNIQNIDEDTKKISLNAIEALKRIAAESQLNKKRVQKFGIKLD